MERFNKIENKKSFVLRDFYKQKIEKLSEQEKKEKSKKINQFLSQLPFLKEDRLKPNSYIAFYKALKQEPCLFETYSQWNKKACFPVIQGDKLEFYTNPDNQWERGSFQIKEPLKIKENKVALEDISLFFIPGSCFDRQGFRFGKGFGYYDKTLSGINKPSSKKSLDFKTQTLWIGVAFLEQLHNNPLPVQAHDIRMDFVVTDEFVFCPLNKITQTKLTQEVTSIKKSSY